MSKILLIFNQYKLHKWVVVVFLLHFNCVWSQNHLTISYGERVNLGAVSQDTHFYISGKVSQRLKGNAINDFVFALPGEYRIKIVEKKRQSKSCNHSVLPKQIIVQVSRIKMIFSNEISFSEPIVKNKDTKGIRLNSKVLIETFDHRPANIDVSEINVAGIGSTITARPDIAVNEFQEGTHTIQYSLNGMVTENAYLMFDFIDANGQIQSIALTQPVKNQL